MNGEARGQRYDKTSLFREQRNCEDFLDPDQHIIDSDMCSVALIVVSPFLPSSRECYQAEKEASKNVETAPSGIRRWPMHPGAQSKQGKMCPRREYADPSRESPHAGDASRST